MVDSLVSVIVMLHYLHNCNTHILLHLTEQKDLIEMKNNKKRHIIWENEVDITYSLMTEY